MLSNAGKECLFINASSVKKNNIKGFTLIEILLVIAILAILAAVIIIAINPAKQFGEAQNTQRRSDVRAILDAVHQYSIDNDGALPEEITEGSVCLDEGENICIPDMSCDGVHIDELVLDQKYLTAIPEDPTASDGQGTGYFIVKTVSGRVSVCAPSAYDDGFVISVTR